MNFTKPVGFNIVRVNTLLNAVGINLGPAFALRVTNDDVRYLARRSGFRVVVTNEDFGPGVQGLFDTLRVEEAAHDPAENVSAVNDRHHLVDHAHVVYHETLIVVRRLLGHGLCPDKCDLNVDTGNQGLLMQTH